MRVEGVSGSLNQNGKGKDMSAEDMDNVVNVVSSKAGIEAAMDNAENCEESIEAVMELLESEITKLEELDKELEARIGPILVSEETPANSSDSACNTENECEMLVKIRSLRYRVSALGGDRQDLMNRIQL